MARLDRKARGPKIESSLKVIEHFTRKRRGFDKVEKQVMPSLDGTPSFFYPLTRELPGVALVNISKM